MQQWKYHLAQRRFMGSAPHPNIQILLEILNKSLNSHLFLSTCLLDHQINLVTIHSHPWCT
jgi:hypothetical protein